MADRIGVTGITAPVDTKSDEDIFPTGFPIRMFGGYKIVADITERNNITAERREVGNLVKVESEGITYKLEGGITNSNWKPCAIDFEIVTNFSDISSSTKKREILVTNGSGGFSERWVHDGTRLNQYLLL